MKTLIATVVLLVAQAGQISPFEGHWRSDVPAERKNLNPGVVPGITFEVTADKVKITDTGLAWNGRPEISSDVYQTDGKSRPYEKAKSIKGLPDSTVVARWSGQLRLDVVFIIYDVRLETVHVTYSISEDRKTLNVRRMYSNPGYFYDETLYR